MVYFEEKLKMIFSYKVVIPLFLIGIWALLILFMTYRYSHIGINEIFLPVLHTSLLVMILSIIISKNLESSIRVYRDKFAITGGGLTLGIHKTAIKKVYLTEKSLKKLERDMGALRVQVCVERISETFESKIYVTIEDYLSFLDAMTKLIGEDKVEYPPSV